MAGPRARRGVARRGVLSPRAARSRGHAGAPARLRSPRCSAAGQFSLFPPSLWETTAVLTFSESKIGKKKMGGKEGTESLWNDFMRNKEPFSSPNKVLFQFISFRKET